MCMYGKLSMGVLYQRTKLNVTYKGADDLSNLQVKDRSTIIIFHHFHIISFV